MKWLARKKWPLLLLVLVAALGLEVGSWGLLKAWYSLRPSDNPRVADYMSRPHPLFANNEDLRAGELEMRFDPYVGRRLLPDHAYVRTLPRYIGVIETDGDGFAHNGQSPAERLSLTDRAYRIVVLGSSPVFGMGASSNAATLPARLEARLRAMWPNVRLQVINAAVPGSISTHERLHYELYLRALRPDAVIMVSGASDARYAAQQDAWQPHWAPTQPYDQARHLDTLRPGASFRQFVESLFSFPEPLYTFAVLHKAWSLVGSGSMGATAPDAAPHHHPEAAIQFERNLLGLGRILANDGTLGLFVLQPHLGGKKGELGGFERDLLAGDKVWADAAERHLRDFAAAMARLSLSHRTQPLRFVDMSDAFDGIAEETYATVSQTNDLGNRILAERIAERFAGPLRDSLMAKGWLQP